MGPHAKEDIMKFQEKLERIDRDLDRHNKLMLATHVDFYAIKEEYVALTDKRNAYEQALKGLQEDIRARKQGKQWKLRSLFFAPKAPHEPPQGGFQLVSNSRKADQAKPEPKPQPEAHEGGTEQLELDLKGLEEKFTSTRNQVDLIRGEYRYKKSRYHEAKLKLEELRHYKERVKTQMNGFLIMYEVKKEEVLKELSRKLQQTSKYQSERVF